MGDKRCATLYIGCFFSSPVTLFTLSFLSDATPAARLKGGEIPQNLPRRRLRRLALAGFSRFCGSLALRTFQCSPLSRLRVSVLRVLYLLFTTSAAKIAFRTVQWATLQSGRFCGTFSAAPARFFTSAQVFARSRPARVYATLDPRQGAPCTCPEPPFTVAPGLCFSRNCADENTAEIGVGSCLTMRDLRGII